MAYRAKTSKTLAKELNAFAKRLLESEIDENYRTNIDLTLRMVERELTSGEQNSRHTKGKLKELADKEQADAKALQEHRDRINDRNTKSRAARAAKTPKAKK